MKQSKLVRYRGQIWEWWGRKDSTGRWILDSLKDGEGTVAVSYYCTVLYGTEEQRQREAIEYFRGLRQ